MATDSPNQQGWLNHPSGRSQAVGCKLDYRAAESREFVSQGKWNKGKVGIAVPLANSALTDVGQPSCMAVPRARLTVLPTNIRKNWDSQSHKEYLSTHIKAAGPLLLDPLAFFTVLTICDST